MSTVRAWLYIERDGLEAKVRLEGRHTRADPEVDVHEDVELESATIGGLDVVLTPDEQERAREALWDAVEAERELAGAQKEDHDEDEIRDRRSRGC